ncbi:hypothetical protein chiPu_0020472 [Chiloscyllium punctatum]|uniref:CYTH domain-containing protein n=1 Tax=Chiloscyllium punctatum TaxID=137246 RepID=A0A401RG57_CHIPU|nr:hypothetical protein [Chiloscyllium punctatum]
MLGSAVLLAQQRRRPDKWQAGVKKGAKRGLTTSGIVRSGLVEGEVDVFLNLEWTVGSENGSGQLIFYQRADMDGPKLSDYSISSTTDPDGLTKVLSDALGVKGIVKKERWLYMVGQTRIHVDQVKGLGNFMELEVVLGEDQSLEEGEAIAQKLMDELGIKKEDLLTGAYMELILADK